MDLMVRFAKIVGTPREDVGRESWVVVEDNFFLVLEMTGAATLSLTTLGKALIEKLAGEIAGLATQNLKNLQAVVQKITVEEQQTLSLLLGLRAGRVFYLISRGAGRVFIRRAGRFGIILSQEESASGLLEDGDLFLLASPRFSEIVSYQEVESLFDHLSLAELAESLTSLIHRVEDTSGVAALILQFEKEKEEIREKELPAEETGLSLEPKRSTFSLLTRRLLFFGRRFFLFDWRVVLDEETKKNRLIFSVVVILAILLLISVILGLQKRQKEGQRNRFGQIYSLNI